VLSAKLSHRWRSCLVLGGATWQCLGCTHWWGGEDAEEPFTSPGKSCLQKHGGVTPLGSTARPSSSWHRIKPLPSQAPEKPQGCSSYRHTSNPKGPLTPSNHPKNPPPPPLPGHLLASPTPQPRFPDLEVLCSPPGTHKFIAPVPGQTPTTNWRIKQDTTINMTTLLKYTYEYKLMIIWIKFTVCKQIY